MTETATERVATPSSYQLVGTLLEACSCGVLCPCWIGEDPDGGECFGINAYNFTAGNVGDVDVSGLSLVRVLHIPGNVLTPTSWKVVTLVDARASDDQRDALVGLFRGKYGGPLADLAGLVAEEVAVRSVPIRHELVAGKGTLAIDGIVDSEMEPYRGPEGTVTTLRDSVFSTVPGSPAWVAKATRHRVNLPEFGMVWEYAGRNAIQSEYRIEHAA